jgi:RHS repeat-associated protein
VETDAAGGLVSLGGKACASDADGNLTSVDGAFSAAYDVENRLVRLERDGRVTEYVHDGVGRRVVRREDGESEYLYRDLDGRLLAEGDGRGGIRAWYVWAEGLLVARVDADGTPQFYLGDRQGSVSALVDADGSVVAAYDYDAFGSITARDGSVEQPYTWQGRSGVEDDGDGLYRVGPREYYAPAGRFAQRDPAYPETGWDPYAYAAGNPVDLVDFTGYDPARSAWNSRFRPPAQDPPGNFIQTPRGKFQLGSPGGGPPPGTGKILSGLTNLGVGLGLGGLKLAAILGITATPVGWAGWTIAGVGAVLGGLRAWAGYKSLRQGMNGEQFESTEQGIIETVDPGGVRTWPGRAYGWVCGVAKDTGQGISNTVDGFKRMLAQANNPMNWVPGGYGY